MNNTNPLIVEESSDKENIFMKPLFALKEIIFNLNQGNIENSVQQTLNLIDTNFPYSFNLSISILVFAAFYAQRNDADISLCYLQSIQNMGEMDENYNILRVFSDYISKINIQEGYYLIEKMIQRKLIGINIIKNIPTKYFAHYKTEKENRIIDIYTYDQTFFENYEELSKNNWELHKKLIEEGNPNEIAQIIRNDEIEKLQEISSQNGFEFSQFIKSSLYERYDFVHFDTSLIDYAAFFRSVKCFKFLLFHGSQIGNAGKYAVAGGNEEIIHLCEQNHSTFFGAYEAAIKFHRNDIFYYIYKKKLGFMDSFSFFGGPSEYEFLIGACIRSGNYDILSFLERKKSLKNSDCFINESARTGNLYLVKKYLQTHQITKNVLVFSSRSGNIELVKYNLEQIGIDINAKDEYENTALLCASYNGYTEIVKLLLEQEGIDINAKNYYGETALIIASSNDYTEIVKLLLEQEGIDINAKNDNGNTALILASSNGRTEIVKLLLEQKEIDIYAKDRDGQTALMYASYNGNTEIVTLLLEEVSKRISTHKSGSASTLRVAHTHSDKK